MLRGDNSTNPYHLKRMNDEGGCKLTVSTHLDESHDRACPQWISNSFRLSTRSVQLHVVQASQKLTVQLQDVFASIGVANNIVSCSLTHLGQADIVGSTPDYRYRFPE
jgi:hypothetical protein